MSDLRTITLRISPDLALNDREAQQIANAARKAAEQQIALIQENRRMWAALKGVRREHR